MSDDFYDLSSPSFHSDHRRLFQLVVGQYKWHDGGESESVERKNAILLMDFKLQKKIFSHFFHTCFKSLQQKVELDDDDVPL